MTNQRTLKPVTKPTKKPVRAVLFDLDGTLVDTARDFVRIIHELASEHGWQAPSDELIREQVSAGSQAMVSLFKQDTLPQTKDFEQDTKQSTEQGTEKPEKQNNDGLTDDGLKDEGIEQLKQQFLQKYEADICVDSQLYAGLEQLLEQLEAQDIPWGVVTNKPRYLAKKLIEQLGLGDRCSVLVCPEDVTYTKPDPEPMHLAMQMLNIDKKDADSVIYIGDHQRDIEAGNAAGNVTVTAGFGYIPATEKVDLASWNADHIVDTSEALLALIDTLIPSINTEINSQST